MTLTAVDKGMIDKGYHYKLIPQNAEFDPLYAKYASGVGPLMREYKDTRFGVVHLGKTRVPFLLNGLGIGEGRYCTINGDSTGHKRNITVELPDGTTRSGDTSSINIDD